MKRGGPSRVWARVRLFLLLMVTAALVPVAYAGWRDLYTRFLEKSAPVISQDEDFPRGIGQTPVSFRWRLEDQNSGLDEVVVRIRQKGKTYEVLRQSLQGRPVAQVAVDFPNEHAQLEEGKAVLTVKVFDRSFWSNAGEESWDVVVDYRKPGLEVLTTQHNAVEGGSQLIIYKAFDENLTLSGVKVGNRTFEGFPAKGLDKDLADFRSVFAAIYAVPAGTDADRAAVRLFAEDSVGNVAAEPFFNKIMSRRWREVTIDVKEGFLREQIGVLAEHNFAKLQAQARDTGRKLEYGSQAGSVQRLVENFRLVNERLRRLNEDEMQGLTTGKRFERLWEGPFMMQSGAIQLAYGTRIAYRFDGEEIGRAFEQGYEMRISRPDRGVIAANDGIVVFSENVGLYGRVIGIDHGFGLISIYGQLESASTAKGDSVTAGQLIGYAGKSGLARGPDVCFELRVQGVAVDAREWWDKEWYFSHILGKIDDVKKTLGLQVPRGL